MDNQEFHVWLQFSTADISGNTLHVPAKQTTSAIAFYHTVNIPPPPPCLQQWEKAIGDAIKALQDAEKLLPGPFKDEKVKEATKALQDAVAGEQACMKNTNKPKVVKAK